LGKFRFSRKSLLLGAGAVVGLLILLALLVDWPMTLAQLRRANPALLGFGAVLLVLGYVAYAIRWQVLMVNGPDFRWTWHAANAGSLVNMLLPLRPGDPARVLMLSGRERFSLIQVTTSIVVERWYEQIMRIAALGGAIVFGVGMQVSLITILGSAVYLVGMVGVMLWMVRRRDWVEARLPGWIGRLPWITETQARHWIGQLLDGLEGMAQVRNQGLALFWSVVSWALFWGYHYALLRAIQPEMGVERALGLSLGALALVQPSATTLPGIYQVSLIVPLALIGYPRGLLASYAVLLNGMELAVVILLGLWGVLRAHLSLEGLLESTIGKPEIAGDQPLSDDGEQFR